MRRENLKNGQFNQCHAELDSASLMRFRIKSGMTEVVGQAGRSMIEMLGVLAVVGLLSVMAFAAFRIALNKAKANTIVHDGRMVWAEALAWQAVPKRNDWIDSRALNESGKSFAVWRDIKDNNYIKVEGVEEEVCEQMLPHQHEGSLLFLTTSFEDLTACPEGENAIVMAFDGLSGKPAECKDQKGCQDLHGLAFYCDGDGHCQECDANISVVNAAGDGCECNPAVALMCDDGNGHTWCCGQDEYGQERICGATPGECTVSNLKCHYKVVVPETRTMVTNCSYRVNISGTNVTVTPEHDSCPTGQYCYLAYKEPDCTLEATSMESGLIYGTCILETMADKTCFYDDASHVMVSEQKGCPVNKYCYLKWTDDSCSVPADSLQSGDIYGVCVGYESTDPGSCS